MICMGAEWFERTEVEDWEIAGTIRNVGRSGRYAPYFIMENKW